MWYEKVKNRVELGSRWYIENVDIQNITQETIQSIYEIEQDMWAHGLGSYIGCHWCGQISWKQDVFNHLSTDIQKKTVADIERLFPGDAIGCPSCQCSDTYYIYDEQYRDENIAARYKSKDSFLSIYKDMSWEIRGFVDAYVSDFHTIYQKEFAPYYIPETQQQIIKKIGPQTLPMLSLNHMWAQQWYVSLILLYHLLKTICIDISHDYPCIDAIYDSILANPIHGIHHAIWAHRLHMTSYLQPDIISEQYPVDMMYHKNAISQTLFHLSHTPMVFFRQYKDTIKSIVNA